jgi:hypothetical protein
LLYFPERLKLFGPVVELHFYPLLGTAVAVTTVAILCKDIHFHRNTTEKEEKSG